MHRIKWKFLFAMGAVLSVALILTPQAKAVPYDVDPAASSVMFTAMIGAATLDLQGAGADVEFFGGTIEATVPLGGGMLTLGSTADFGDSFIPGLGNAAAPFLPTIGGALLPGADQVFADGTEDSLEIGDGVFSGAGISAGTGLTIAENYGYSLAGVAFLAVRDLALTAEGSGMTGGAATGIGWNFASGFLGVDASVLGVVTDSFIGQDASDPEVFNSGGIIGYSLVGSLETITLPVDITIDDGDNTFILSGSIVASRVIPEPTTLALFGIGLCSSLLMRRRHQR